MASRRRDGLGLALLAALLLGWFAIPLLATSGGFPLGPDAPVYLWWTRIAGVEGLSAVGERGGVPAVALAIAGTLRIGPAEVLAALEAVLATCAGVASALLLRSAGQPRSAWFAGGALAGAFASHLAAGYLANLGFVVTFLAAVIALGIPGRRSTVAATAMLGAAGLAHPLFLGIGAAVLVLAAGSSRRDDPAAARRLLTATIGGGAVLGVASLAALTGAPPLDVDTSRDAFLRRAGLTDLLRDSYLDRFLARWTRYAPWAALPAMALGWNGPRGMHGRVLRAWVLVCGVGLVVAIATRTVPPDRFVMVAFGVPMLAGIGVARLARRRPRLLATAAAAIIAGAFLLASSGAWTSQRPFVSASEMDAADEVAAAVADSPAGTVTLVGIAVEGPSAAFDLTRLGDIVRTRVPAGRIREVVVVAEVPPTQMDAEIVALARLTADDARRATAGGRDAIRVTLSRIATGAPIPDVAAVVHDGLGGTTSAGTARAVVGALALLWLVGIGWTRSFIGDRITANALAPAVGTAALMLAAVLLDRLGVRVVGAAALAASAATAAAGLYLGRRVQRGA